MQIEAVESSMGKQNEQLDDLAVQIQSASQALVLSEQMEGLESRRLQGLKQLDGLESRVASRVEMQIKSVESRMESRMSEQSEQLSAVSAQLRQVLDLLAQGTPQPPPLRQ
jgi:hypothetical protein